MKNRESVIENDLAHEPETMPTTSGITRIEALNYRSLRYINQPLGPFHVLVGPNASGKTTFLDVIGFLGNLVTEGLDSAIYERAPNFSDLVFGRSGDKFQLAVEAGIPKQSRGLLSNSAFEVIRYEIGLGVDPETHENVILNENAFLKISNTQPPQQRLTFPNPQSPPRTILNERFKKGEAKRVMSKVKNGNDNFYSEVYGPSGKGWAPSFRLGPRKSALGNLPEDESKFPVTTWLKRLLIEGVQQFTLNSLLIRKASPPGQIRNFKPDGSNLPWVIDALQKRDPKRFKSWITHVQTALPDIENIRTIERPDDKHRYLVIRYSGGWELPSWVVSDGTLRLLALTLPAYLVGFEGVYLIEEPENGIHPRAVETVFQSLSSTYDAQILLATHSPVILSLAQPSTVLCFGKNAEGATDIVSGTDHPALREWRGETDLGSLFGAGVLG